MCPRSSKIGQEKDGHNITPILDPRQYKTELFLSTNLGFRVIRKVGNDDIFVLLKFENNFNGKTSQLNLIQSTMTNVNLH